LLLDWTVLYILYCDIQMLKKISLSIYDLMNLISNNLIRSTCTSIFFS